MSSVRAGLPILTPIWTHLIGHLDLALHRDIVENFIVCWSDRLVSRDSPIRCQAIREGGDRAAVVRASGRRKQGGGNREIIGRDGRKAYWPNEPNAPQHQGRVREATGVATCGVWAWRAMSGVRLWGWRDPALALGALMMICFTQSETIRLFG